MQMRDDRKEKQIIEMQLRASPLLRRLWRAPFLYMHMRAQPANGCRLLRRAEKTFARRLRRSFVALFFVVDAVARAHAKR